MATGSKRRRRLNRQADYADSSASMLMRSPLARERRRPAGFIVPCQPTLSDKAPTGPLWLHEIKHDGYRRASKAIF